MQLFGQGEEEAQLASLQEVPPASEQMTDRHHLLQNRHFPS
jgi:hypothetical protein